MKKIALMLALIAAPVAANANLITNGSFEADAQASGTVGFYGALTGWTLGSGPAIELRNDVFGTASDGVNYVELDSTGNSSFFQAITTTAGTSYVLDFDYSPRVNQLANTNGIEAYWNGQLLVKVTGKGGSVNNWVTEEFNVIGTGNDVLTFKAVGISDSLGGNIDNVILSAVPEPTTLGMMFAGLGLVGFAARRRQA